MSKTINNKDVRRLNKIENKKIVIFLILSMIFGFLIGNLVFDRKVISVNPPINGQIIEEPARYEIISGAECIRTKGFWGINNECQITIKNLEDKPADFQAFFKCSTIENEEQIKSTEKKPLSGGETRIFTYEYKTKNDFKCILDCIESSNLVKIN